MKWVDEYRDHSLVKKLSSEIRNTVTRPWIIMEICGGQTHSILKYGLDNFLPESINLIHGPGCPVCVTPLKKIDQALEIATFPNTMLLTFGDMMRVPGSKTDFQTLKAEGKNIDYVYSPLDAVKIARQNPDKQIVFFGVGFETTAPANAMSIKLASQMGLTNYSVLSSQVTVPPAIEFLMSQPECKIQSFLAAGHVCSIMGYWQYVSLASQFRIPIVVTGFEPVDILEGILLAVRKLEVGDAKVENQYHRVVTREGNLTAQFLINEIFEVSDMGWRGIGDIPKSGLKIREKYSQFDAEKKFCLSDFQSKESQDCESGQVLQGLIEPTQCKAFGKKCTPEHPLGSPMVSSEGACAAYFHYKKSDKEEIPEAAIS